jgi:3-dehydro-L-gulonate 2-dehydrogenase
MRIVCFETVQSNPMRVTYQELYDVLHSILRDTGLEPERAALSARLFAEASRDGFASHGLNRFPRFIDQIRSGIVDVAARPARIDARGAVERWDGRSGPGNLNAYECMQRAIDLAREHGIGCVALANTNHWMRGGSYGWQAADGGAIGICWTNTLPNLPPWGASDPRVGNNPLVIALPRREGHVVLDMAMSQFSYGALESFRLRGEPLPVVGGFDVRGELTRDPAAIEASKRPVPIGFWKGSGLALMLDLIAALLSNGRSSWQVPADPDAETGLSQVFIAFDLASLGEPASQASVVERVIEHLRTPADAGAVRYPGERTLETRRRNLSEGVPVDAAVWTIVRRLVK